MQRRLPHFVGGDIDEVQRVAEKRVGEAMTARLANLGFATTPRARQFRPYQFAHDLPGAAGGGVRASAGY
jgi:hypothetical protein